MPGGWLQCESAPIDRLGNEHHERPGQAVNNADSSGDFTGPQEQAGAHNRGEADP
jgi:hypothetical protein